MSGDPQASHAHTSVRGYLLVFAGLGLLTGLTVVLSYAGLSHRTAIVLAGLIALVKCTLIGFFFMHLRFERRVIYLLLATALALVLNLLFGIMPDIGFPGR